MTTSGILTALFLAGLMGLVGQGARVVVGLKKLRDENLEQSPSEQDSFIASRLFVSLMIGFITGIAAGFLLGLPEIAKGGIEMLMGLAAAGYAGTDAIEAFTARLTPPPAAKSDETAKAELAKNQADADAQLIQVKADVAALKAMVPAAAFVTAATTVPLAISPAAPIVAVPPTVVPAVPAAALTVEATTALDTVTADKIKLLFATATPYGNIVKHLPSVVAGLLEQDLTDAPMLWMALGTIRAESEGFVPISEYKSIYNTDKTPFDLYDAGTEKGKKLGNTVKGDGLRYRGRGFIQLTGRYNYKTVGEDLDLDLEDAPELANDSAMAGRILARFIKNKEQEIRDAIKADDLKKARRLVNGGQHGFDRFEKAYRAGQKVFPA